MGAEYVYVLSTYPTASRYPLSYLSLFIFYHRRHDPPVVCKEMRSLAGSGHAPPRRHSPVAYGTEHFLLLFVHVLSALGLAWRQSAVVLL